MIEPIFIGIIWGFFAGWNMSATVNAPKAQVQIQQPAATVVAEKGEK